MSFLDSLFGPSETSTTTKVEYPKFIEDFSKKNLDLAKSIASRPYTPYPFQRLAGFTGDQKSAMGMLRNYAPTAAGRAGQPFGVPRLIDDVGEGGSIEAYMNPYIDQVLDRTQARIGEAADYAKQWQSNMGAHSQGAFGDARHGVADSLIDESAIKQMSDASADAYSQAYQSAQGLRQYDINNLYQNAQMDRAQQQDYLSFIDALYRSGSNQQALDQQSMTLGYEDFLKQWQYPIDQYNLLVSALTQTPYGQTTTNSQPGPSPAASILGTLGSILSLF